MDNEYIISQSFSEEEHDSLITEAPPSFPEKHDAGLFLEKVIVAVLLATIFLLPLFFFPVPGTFVELWKNIFLSCAVITLLIGSIALSLVRGSLFVPVHPIFFSLGAIGLVYLVSSIASGVFSVSFFGSGMEVGTSLEIFLFILLAVFTAIFLRTKQRIFYAHLALLSSALLALSFQTFHIWFKNSFTLFGLFPSQTQNFVGKWSDMGMFSGLTLILALTALVFLPSAKKLTKGVLYVLTALSFFIMATVTYTASWIILFFLTSLLVVCRSLFKRKEMKGQSFFLFIKNGGIGTPLVIAILSLPFLFLGQAVSDKIFGVFKIPPFQEVRPSMSGTFDTVRGTFFEGPKEMLLGAGPNRFSMEWDKYHPSEVTLSPWWNIDFYYGVGTIPTAAVEVGALGLLAWMIFFVIFLFLGYRALLFTFESKDAFTRYFVTSSFFGALFLWIVSFVNVSGVVPLALAFSLTGLFIGSLFAGDVVPFHEYSYVGDRQKGFIFMVTLLLFLGAAVFGGYWIFQKYRSFFMYREAVLAAQNQNKEMAEVRFTKALGLMKSDLYSRDFSLLELYRAQEILRKDLSPDDLRLQFGASFQSSIVQANNALKIDPKNYKNYLVSGNVFASLVPLKIKDLSDDAYQKAKDMYGKAALLKPKDPRIPYEMARISLSGGNTEDAKVFLKKALSLKSNYSDASSLLALVESDSGNTKNALLLIKTAIAEDPSNIKLFFELGFLQYRNANYLEAVSSLEKAVSIQTDYSNARYFLGLSYYHVGRTVDAIKQFEKIKEFNPDNSEVVRILNNLQTGRSPLNNSDFSNINETITLTETVTTTPSLKPSKVR